MITSPEAAEVNAALARVYARPEFATVETSGLVRALADLWAAVRHWVGAQLMRLLPESSLSIATVALIALALILAVWAAFALIGSLDRARADSTGAGVALQVRPRENAAFWEDAARSAAARGEFRDAALALYLAAVLRLEQRGVLRYESGKTPGQYRREARREASIAPVFDRFIRHLLPVAFGAREPAADAFSRVRASAIELGVNA